MSEGGWPWSLKDICESFGREREEGLRMFWMFENVSESFGRERERERERGRFEKVWECKKKKKRKCIFGPYILDQFPFWSIN